MSEKTISANRIPKELEDRKEEFQILESLAKDHYLVLQEKEEWKKGVKQSNPTLRHISIGDMESFVSDRYFENHEITVIILHDPTYKEGDKVKEVKLVKKEDLIKKYADMIEVPIESIDPKITIKELNVLIAQAEEDIAKTK